MRCSGIVTHCQLGIVAACKHTDGAHIVQVDSSACSSPHTTCCNFIVGQDHES